MHKYTANFLKARAFPISAFSNQAVVDPNALKTKKTGYIVKIMVKLELSK